MKRKTTTYDPTDHALANLCGLLMLACSRRTRPLAGALYGVLLSRAQGAGLRRLDQEVGRLFDERTSVGKRVDHVERRMARQAEINLGGRVAILERIVSAQYGDIALDLIDLGVRSDAPAEIRLPVWKRAPTRPVGS